MTFLPYLLHSVTMALSVVGAALGVSIGQGIATNAAVDAIQRQPSAESDISRGLILALAFNETAAIFGFLMAFLLFLAQPVSVGSGWASLGIAAALSTTGLIIGIASSLPAAATMYAIARQPFFAKKLGNFMLICQALIQTPLIFALLVAFIIRNQLSTTMHVGQGLTLLGSGIAIGIGSLGAAIGGGLFTSQVCTAIALNKNAYSKLFNFTFISQAIIETPVIFAAIIALVLSSQASSVQDSTPRGLIYLFCGACIGFGTLGAGISSGRTAAAAAHQIALRPQAYQLFSRASIFSQGLIDSCAVYPFIVSLLLILNIF